jgi:hypothetical protein
MSSSRLLAGNAMIRFMHELLSRANALLARISDILVRL